MVTALISAANVGQKGFILGAKVNFNSYIWENIQLFFFQVVKKTRTINIKESLRLGFRLSIVVSSML